LEEVAGRSRAGSLRKLPGEGLHIRILLEEGGAVAVEDRSILAAEAKEVGVEVERRRKEAEAVRKSAAVAAAGIAAVDEKERRSSLAVVVVQLDRDLEREQRDGRMFGQQGRREGRRTRKESSSTSSDWTHKAAGIRVGLDLETSDRRRERERGIQEVRREGMGAESEEESRGGGRR